MILAWVNSLRPSTPCSRPIPDCLAPPNGTSHGMSRCLFTHTVPDWICNATWRPRSASLVQIVPPSPYRSEEHTSELQSLMRTSYAVFCLHTKQHHSLDTVRHLPTIHP